MQNSLKLSSVNSKTNIYVFLQPKYIHCTFLVPIEQEKECHMDDFFLLNFFFFV